MHTATTTEPKPVGRKKKPSETPSGEPPFERVEFQAPIGWSELVDEAAKQLGLSRSAYIRMAVSRQMQHDRKEREGG